MVMTDETVVDVLDVAEKVLVEVSERVKVSQSIPARSGKTSTVSGPPAGKSDTWYLPAVPGLEEVWRWCDV